jgi:multimeric flavodoxin WrbA
MELRKMKLLGIVGSPRSGGNTELLVKEAMKPAEEAGWETDVFLASEKQVAPCDACAGCFKTGKCVIQDDMQELYQKMIEADAIIIGSPVYFGNVTAQLKAIIDRTYAILRTRPLKGKVAGVIVVTRRVGAALVRSMLYSYCIGQGMIVAGGGIGYGREIGDVLEGVGGAMDSTAMGEARQVGVNLVDLVGRFAPNQ